MSVAIQFPFSRRVDTDRLGDWRQVFRERNRHDIGRKGHQFDRSRLIRSGVDLFDGGAQRTVNIDIWAGIRTGQSRATKSIPRIAIMFV